MKWFPCLLALPLLAAAPLPGQQPGPLTQGRTVAGALAHGDTNRYTVALPARRFVYGEADQQSVDVVVTIFGPDGRRLGAFDGPGNRGLEPFLIRTAEAGTYRIEVTPFAQETGRYAIGVLRSEPLATSAAGRIDQLMAPYTGSDRAGGVVAVTRGGAIVFARGYGMANLEDGLANSPATVFHVASVSKQFTAFAVATLADQGRLALDDDVRRYLPEVPDFGRTITLRHLLTHTSGLRDQWDLWGLSGGLLGDVIRQQDLLRLVQRQRELNFDPGAEYLYSNTGFMLLSEVVARVTGQPFPDWMHDNVFVPLGMSATQVYDDVERLVPGRAYSYQQGAGGVRKSVLSYANMGATSLFTTVPDLARWLRNWHTAAVGGPTVLAMMQQRGVLTRGDTLPYALGIGVDTWRGQRRLSHSGSDAGYRAFLSYFPALDAGVIVLGNAAVFNAGGVAEQVAEVFLARDLAPPAPAAPAAPRIATPAPWRPGPADLAAFAGSYLSPELETIYTILVQDGMLVARHRRHGDLPLTPAAPDAFDAGQWFFGRVRFERDSTGRVTSMRVSTSRVRALLFRRLP
jgi:CubicO group peptidase (beta-lactamase class C family)